MRSPVSCELGTCSISSESSPSTIWGAAAIPPGLHEPVWAELDRHALRLFGPRRKPVREGQGLLRKQRRRTDPPIAGLAPSRRYLAGVAKRYCARPPQPRRASRHDLDRLVDPHGLIAQARSQSGVAPVGTRQSRTRGVPRRSEAVRRAGAGSHASWCCRRSPAGPSCSGKRLSRHPSDPLPTPF